MSVIELGYLDAEPAPAEPDGFDSRRRRRLLAALVAVLCLATLAASVRPQSHLLRPLWSVPGGVDSVYAVVGDTVVVMSGESRRTLSGYALRDGTRRWSRELADRVLPYLSASRDSRRLLMSVGERTVPLGVETNRIFYTRTVAVDVATGAELWRGTGTVAGEWPDTGTALLAQPTPNGAGTSRLRLVRTTDGGQIWSRETPGVRQWLTVGTDRVATVAADGSVRLLRLTDGAYLVSGKILWDPGRPDDGEYNDLLTHGNALYVVRTTSARARIIAYAADTFTPLWTALYPLTGTGLFPCGATFCVGVADGIEGHDWDTGALRWRIADQDYAMPLRDGLLLGQTRDGTRHVLFDSATGRVVADLATAQPIDGVSGDTMLVLSRTTPPASRSVVRRIDLDNGEISLVGTLDTVNDWGCTLIDRALFCKTESGVLTVTAVG